MNFEVNTTYEPFSREPEYIEGNRAFLKDLPLQGVRRMLDLACGTGTISELVMEISPGITIMGLDLSRESLSLGKSDFLEKGMVVEDTFVLSDTSGKTRVVLVEGTADCLPFGSNWADLVFMGHSIHMVPDVDRLLDEICRVLGPDGLFAFNSSFYAGSQAPGTDFFYQTWWKKALQYILEKDAEQRQRGLPGIRRVRGSAPKAFSAPWYSKDEWGELLERHGFEVLGMRERTITMTQSNIEKIGSYGGLARLMISGYPVELASEALVASVAPAMQEAGLKDVPRLWLEVTAKKR